LRLKKGSENFDLQQRKHIWTQKGGQSRNKPQRGDGQEGSIEFLGREKGTIHQPILRSKKDRGGSPGTENTKYRTGRLSARTPISRGKTF